MWFLTLKMEKLRSFETSRAIRPMTQHRIQKVSIPTFSVPSQKKKNYCAQPCADLTNVGFKNDGCIESGSYIVMSAYQSIDYPTHLPAIPLPENIALAFNITLINLQPSFCVCQFGSEFSTWIFNCNSVILFVERTGTESFRIMCTSVRVRLCRMSNSNNMTEDSMCLVRVLPYGLKYPVAGNKVYRVM